MVSDGISANGSGYSSDCLVAILDLTSAGHRTKPPLLISSRACIKDFIDAYIAAID